MNQSPDRRFHPTPSSTEDELRTSAAIFAGILEISVDAAISIDEEQRIVLFNHGAENIFGYSPEEVLGRPVAVLLPERFRAAHSRHVRAFGEGVQAARRMGDRSEIYGLRKSGEEFPAEASISRLDVDGQRIYSVVLRDVGEQKEYQRSLERQARELERSNRALEEFAAIASHDLQEPLRKIRAFGGLLMAGAPESLGEKNREHLDRMMDASTRMAALINDLLAFARVTSRTSPFVTVDLAAVVNEVVADLEVRVRETGGRIEVGDLPVVQADRSQMGQLFQNLIGNALKYRRPDVPPEVVVSGNVRLGPQAQVDISVRDNGIGFDEKYRDRIFEIFQRLHGRGTYEGTGMGLAICKKIVERHDGTITASSAPGAGSTFVLTLPACQR